MNQRFGVKRVSALAVSFAACLFFSVPAWGAFESPPVGVEVVPSSVPGTKGSVAEVGVRLSIPPGHHGYLDKGDEGYYIPISIKFSGMTGGNEVKEGAKPQGERDGEVRAQVLRGVGEFRYTLRFGDGVSGGIGGEVAYQICNDATKICFPPSSKKFTIRTGIDLKEENVSEQPNNAQKDTEKTNDISGWVTEKFNRAANNLPLALLLALLAGILAAATPCVYPMLPITVAIMANRGHNNPGAKRNHSLAYFLGIVATYGLLGLFAGLTGGALNAIMQHPAVNVVLGSAFLFFGLALFDIIPFSLFENLSAKVGDLSAKNSSYSGTFLMGVAAGVVISPCVGPVVFAILLQVADRIADLANAMVAAGKTPDFFDKLTIAGEGGIITAAFGAGVGLPFLFLGVLSGKLPKSGAWMMKVKFFLGGLIGAVGYLYLYKGFSAAGLQGAGLYCALGAVTLLFASGVLFVLKRGDKKFFAGAFVLLLLGLILSWQGVVSRQVASEAPVATGVEVHKNLTWQRDAETARKLAKETGKPLFIDFFAYWCANCIAFGELTLSDERLNKALQGAVLLKVYDTDPVFQEYKRMPDFRELNVGLPFFVIQKPNGDFYWKTTRYDDVE